MFRSYAFPWMVAGVVCSRSALAEPVTWRFEGVISFTRNPSGEGPEIHVGDPFSGSLTWDDSWTGPHGTPAFFAPELGFTFNVAGHSFDAMGNIELNRN